MTMLPLKAHVKNGRLVLDEPTDLPEGDVIELVPRDGDLGPPRSWPPQLVALLSAPVDPERAVMVDAMQHAIERARRNRRRAPRL